MFDDSSPSDFEEYLKTKNLKYDTVAGDGNKRIYRVSDYVIPNGNYAGTVVQLGLPIPADYPTTAPYGVHVKSEKSFENIKNVNASFLGAGWQFWSRQINNWSPGRRNAQYYMDHVDRWLEVN
jgi:hypothetical protein